LERVRGRASHARRPDHLVLGDWQPPVGGKPGGQRRYSNIAIEAALTVRAVYDLAKRCRVYYLLGFNEKVPGLFSENKPGTFSRFQMSPNEEVAGTVAPAALAMCSEKPGRRH
jgi:hypothetical protein